MRIKKVDKMREYVCDDCGKHMHEFEVNTVSLRNVYNKKVHAHYCAVCAVKRFPQFATQISWTTP